MHADFSLYNTCHFFLSFLCPSLIIHKYQTLDKTAKIHKLICTIYVANQLYDFVTDINLMNLCVLICGFPYLQTIALKKEPNPIYALFILPFLLNINLVIQYLSPVKRICVFEHSVTTSFNCACPAIQRGQGSGFLSEGSS